MIQHVRTWLLIALAVVATVAAAKAQEPRAARYYLIGNSLTWDTVPEKLSGDVQWHVDCGTSLSHIYAHPGNPCVKSSTLWPTALRDKRYDVVSVQPHYGSTLAQDAETISAWMELQPAAVFVIHTGWARHSQLAEEFESYVLPEAMVHSPAYFRNLVAELRRRHPGREIRQTLAQNLLMTIAADIAAKQAPFAKLEELYRDDIHLTIGPGRYLMHNAMRLALGQKLSDDGFENIVPEVRKYLDGVLKLAATAEADKALLAQIISLDPSTSRSTLAARLTDGNLKSRLTELLPEIERAAEARREARALEAEIADLGGRVIGNARGPQWLYVATGDRGMELFDVPATIDLYNGNNPLKGKGGRNERVTDDWLKRIAGIATLRKLDLANCAIQGEGLQHVGTLTGLRELNLTLTPVTDEFLKPLANLSELRSLGLASTQCNGTGFVHLKSLKKLQNVNFHFTPLNDAGLRAISQVPISDRLWFAHTHFTDAGAASLSALTQLKRCGIGSKEPGSSGEAVSGLVNLPLEDLALLDNQATAAGLAHAAKIATLRRLDASYAPTVTDESMPLVASMPMLEEFKLGSAQVTDEGLQLLAASKSLKKLTLSGMKKITPAGIAQLRTSRPELIVESP